MNNIKRLEAGIVNRGVISLSALKKRQVSYAKRINDVIPNALKRLEKKTSLNEMLIKRLLQK